VTISQIPAEVDGLITLLSDTQPRDRHEIAERLAEQIGDRDKAYKLFDEAEAVVRNGEEIEELRGELAVELAEIEMSLRKARGLIDRLASDQVYDVEYAEGLAAVDLRQMLADASRAVRIARVLQKQIGS
jgi:hypothetical protein